MADSVVQVDLSEQAADYRRLALQPGMALIDRGGAHSAILRKWLGANLAEPAWDGNFVKYQMRAEDGAVFHPKEFKPLTAAECKGAFRGEIEAMAQKLEAAPARTGTERALRHVMQDRLKKLQADPNYAAQSGALAKYLDPEGRWRLSWLWGFERKTSEPGTVVICKKPACRTLGVLTDDRRTCAACGAKLKASRSLLPLVAAVLLLVLIGGGIGYYLTRPPAPAVTKLASLKGQVFSAAGQKPLANARVAVEGTETQVQTDAEGQFELTELSPKTYTVRIHADGFREETLETDLANDPSFLKVRLKGVAGIKGLVKDAINYAPIKNASVRLPAWGVSVQTDDQGEFELRDLPGGKIQIEATAEGFQTKAIEETLASGEARRIEFQLAGQGKVVGTVMDALTLQPVSNATVFLLNTPLTATTGPTGRFEITGIPTGEATIAVQAAGYQAEHTDQKLEGTETRPLLVGLHGAGVVRGRVKSQADDQPLAGAKVEIVHPKFPRTLTTNARGEFEFQKLPPSNQELRVALDGYREVKLKAEATEAGEPVEVVLSGDASLSGIVTDAVEKKPIANAEVRIKGTELLARTGEDGSFRLTNIPGRNATVQFVGQGYRQVEVPEDFKAEKEANINVELKGGTILSGQVIDALTKAPIPAAEVVIAGTEQKTATDGEGRFRFEDLVAGTKSLSVSAKGYQPAEQPAELKTEEESAVEVALKGDAVLSGTVVSAAGEKPLAGAKVKIAGRSQETQTDKNGRFRLESVPSGTADLEITRTGYQPGSVSRDLVSGEETQVDIALSGAASLVGSVVTQDGQPIENASVSVENASAGSTSDTGEFRLEGLVPGGGANVTISAKGFHPEHKATALHENEPTSLGEITLRPIEPDPVGVAKAFETPAPEGVIAPAASLPMDDFRTRLDRANAKTGDVQVSMAWDNVNDIDLHVQAPSGEVIYYSHRRSDCGGELDVDMNANGPDTNEPVENVYWPLGAAPRGKYKVLAHHYANHGGTDPTEFRVVVKNGDEVKYYTGKVNPLEKVLVCEFERLEGPEATPLAQAEPVPHPVGGNVTTPNEVPPPMSEDGNQRKRPPVYNRSEEEQAAQRLKLAEDLLALNKRDAAKRWLEDVVSRYPNTKACEKCQKLLDEMASESSETNGSGSGQGSGAGRGSDSGSGSGSGQGSGAGGGSGSGSGGGGSGSGSGKGNGSGRGSGSGSGQGSGSGGGSGSGSGQGSGAGGGSGSRSGGSRGSRGSAGSSAPSGTSGESGPTTPRDGIYLTELTPVRKNVGGDVLARAATIQGTRKHHSIWTRTNLPNPPASAEYVLDQKYSYLSGSVGIDDSGQADRTRVSTSFQIIGDGQVLWSSESLREPGKSQRFEVDVSQVNSLKILTDSDQNPSHYAVWIDPYLTGRGTD